MKLSIGLTEALCGFKIPIKHLDNRELIISNPQGKVIEPGEFCVYSALLSELFCAKLQLAEIRSRSASIGNDICMHLNSALVASTAVVTFIAQSLN